MSIKVLVEESFEYAIYAVKYDSESNEDIELNDDCKRAAGFADKSVAIGYAICMAENFDFSDVFVTEIRTVHNYWSKEEESSTEKIIWSSMKIDDEKAEESDNTNENSDEEIYEETDELVDSDK